MNKKIDKKLKGVRFSHRNRWLLLRDGFLTREEFLLFQLYVDLADWHKAHGDTYGTFEATNDELAPYLGYKDGSTVSKIKKRLIAKKLLIHREQLHKVPNIERYLGKSLSGGTALEYAAEEKKYDTEKILENMQDNLEYEQDEIAVAQEVFAESQEKKTDLSSKSSPQALVSYKEDIGLIKREREYKREGKLSGLHRTISEQLPEPPYSFPEHNRLSRQQKIKEVQRLKKETDRLDFAWHDNPDSDQIKIARKKHKYLSHKLLDLETDLDLLPI